MDGAKPIYVKLLIAAIVIYIIGVTIMQADMYIKIVRIEHSLYDHVLRMYK
ncbi:MAG: hypothetical protein WBB86_07580 [Candidatus Omnitrophota bacterium]